MLRESNGIAGDISIIKRCTLRWFSYVERISDEWFRRKIYKVHIWNIKISKRRLRIWFGVSKHRLQIPSLSPPWYSVLKKYLDLNAVWLVSVAYLRGLLIFSFYRKLKGNMVYTIYSIWYMMAYFYYIKTSCKRVHVCNDKICDILKQGKI